MSGIPGPAHIPGAKIDEVLSMLNRRELFRAAGGALAGLLALRHPFQGDSDDTSASRSSQQAAPTADSSYAWAGDATQTTVEISAYTVGATSVGLAVSPTPDMAQPTWWPSNPPNAAGWNKWSVTGLTPGVRYFRAWGEVVPARMTTAKAQSRGRYRSEVEGNVRYVKLDTRSPDKTDTVTRPTDPRSSKSTMLGATQLKWLQFEISQAAAQYQLVVLYSDCAWNGTSPGPPIPVSYSDKWPSYLYERDLISDYAARAGAKMLILFGDSHGMQFDDGTHEKNGFASLGVGPLDSPLHMHCQDSYQGNYPQGIDEGGGP